MKHLLRLFSLFILQLAAGEPAVGETVWVGGRYFQFAGTNPAGEALYFYPHTDGVAELFVAPAKGVWAGSFESRFDSSSGQFENLFNAGEVAIEELADFFFLRIGCGFGARLRGVSDGGEGDRGEEEEGVARHGAARGVAFSPWLRQGVA